MATSLELAIAAIRSGRHEEGRQLLNLLIQQNPNNEMAWLWMSSVVSNDEQRARCLYHVLAINPNNAIARKGLEVLGIVVSDSRPVKVPRDSQPIRIPRPSPQPQTGPLRALPEPQSPLARAKAQNERRPFRVDPQTIVEELPFSPVSPPFSKPVPATHSNQEVGSVQSAPQVLGQTQRLQNPSEPVSVVQSGPAASGWAPNIGQQMEQTPPTETGPFPGYAQQSIPSQPPDTRPTQLQPSPQANPSVEMPASAQNYYAGQPSGGPPQTHSNVTMGMPTQHFAAQPPVQQLPSVHSQATMGVPVHFQNPNGQLPAPSEPGPVVHSNTTMGMSLPGYLQPQQPMMQSPGMHSSATMAMPTYTNVVDYRMATPGPPPQSYKPKNQVGDDEEEEGINILAVIIFGSLSVTALGGLGMLILLMFTTG